MRSLLLCFLILLSPGCRSDSQRLALDYVELMNAMERGEGSGERAKALAQALAEVDPSTRMNYLKRQVESVIAHYEILEGRRASFDEESFRLYGIVAPPPDLDEAKRIRDELDGLLPGDGPLVARYVDFQRRFLVPREKVERVFGRAIEECRRRTLAHLELPKDESTELELVSGKDWPAFSSYQGNYRTVIQVNVDFPLPIGRVVEIAAHEAYPGHHTASILRDEKLVVGRNLPEFSIEPLIGPDALVREGLAAFAVEIVFPAQERLELERDVLFPLAGVDPADSELHAKVEHLVAQLRPLLVDGARQYLDRQRDRVASAIWLENEAVVPDPWAFLRFVDRYRTYVVTYTGEELLRLDGESDPWHSFAALLLVTHETT